MSARMGAVMLIDCTHADDAMLICRPLESRRFIGQRLVDARERSIRTRQQQIVLTRYLSLQEDVGATVPVVVAEHRNEGSRAPLDAERVRCQCLARSEERRVGKECR